MDIVESNGGNPIVVEAGGGSRLLVEPGLEEDHLVRLVTVLAARC